MSYNSHRPLDSYSLLELGLRTLGTVSYYGTYGLLYAFYYKPRALLKSTATPTGNAWFEKYVAHYHPRPEFAYFKADEGRCFAGYASRLAGPRLEIGYEDGRISAYHLPDLHFAVGLEYDPAVAGRRPEFDHYTTLVPGSFQSIPFPPEYFKSVVAIHVLDHIPDLDACLAEAARVLTPDGRLAVSLFSQEALEQLRPSEMRRFNLHHFLTRAEWEAKLQQHGFVLEAWQEITCSRWYLPLYFLGMRTFIPHDRSLAFQMLDRWLPWMARIFRTWLKDVTRCMYFEPFLMAETQRTDRGANCFISARRVSNNHG